MPSLYRLWELEGVVLEGRGDSRVFFSDVES